MRELTNDELRAEIAKLDEEIKADREARGVPPEPPADFVPIAAAWAMYERCEPLFKFAIRYAQLCDQADEILELTDEQIAWIKSFRKYTDLITKVKDGNMLRAYAGSMDGLISTMEKRDEYEALIEMLRILMLEIGFLKGDYSPPGLHQFVYLHDASKEENNRYREEVYAEIERLKDEEYFEQELERLTDHYNSIKNLY